MVPSPATQAASAMGSRGIQSGKNPKVSGEKRLTESKLGSGSGASGALSNDGADAGFEKSQLAV